MDARTERSLKLSRLAVVVLAAVAAALFVFFIFDLVGHPAGAAVADCTSGPGGIPRNQPSQPPFNPPLIGWGGFVVLACGAGFLSGKVWGHWRTEAHGRLAQPSVASRPVLQLVVTGLFLFGAVALGYETFSLAGAHGNPDLWPITYYVRCAHDAASLPTLGAAVLIAVLVGHWLGYEPVSSPD